MIKRLWALALVGIMLCLPISSSLAAMLGPASSADELCALLDSAGNGDIILVSGSISAHGRDPLTSDASVQIRSEDGAMISGLRLRDASITFSGVSFSDSLVVDGTSHIHLGRSVSVVGGDGQTGLSFSGSGTLIVESDCDVSGGKGSSGISISHDGGEFYGSIEGRIRGGDGSSGGAGVVVSPLQESGALMIAGSIQGGNGSSVGGHALNLYGLSGNAFVTVDGSLQGGSGAIGGDGIQLVAASDMVNVGISGRIKGGQGESYGGNAMIMMNAEDASSVKLSGYFSGGDAIGEHAQPGTSLRLVGDSVSARTHVDNCILEDGMNLIPSPTPVPVPLPEADSESSESDSGNPFTDESNELPEATPSEASPEVVESTPAEATEESIDA